MLLAILALLSLAQTGPALELEGLDGARRLLPLSELPLPDPRAREAWVLRPRGFPAAAALAGEARVRFADGNELVGRVQGGEGERFGLDLAEGVHLSCALESVRSIVFPARIPLAERGKLGPAPEGDRLYRRGVALDVLDGTIEGFGAEGLRFDGVLGKSSLPWSEVAALYVAALGDSGPAPAARGVPVTIDFAGEGGGRARGDLLALEREGVRVVLAQSEVRLPWNVVSELVVADGRLTFLSELEPRAESGRGSPFDDDLGMQWPHRRDASVNGTPLRRAGELVRRGIGMHAPSTLTFALEGGFRSLRGEVAIDESTRLLAEAARGSVIFRLRADGELLWESPLVRGGDAPLAFGPLSVAGKKELVLELDPAGDFAGDRGNWLGLALLR